MEAAQAGDGADYARLLREIVPYVSAIVRRHHAASDRVEDVVQDVLLTLHRVRHTYDPARPFTAWLGAIAHRRSIDALRRKVRTDASETFSPVAYETYADPGANKDIAAHEDGAVLAEAIAALPPGQRQAVELLRLKGDVAGGGLGGFRPVGGCAQGQPASRDSRHAEGFGREGG